MAKWLGVKHAIGVNSCTAALHLALIAYDIGQGDEVITSPYTFCSSANVIVHAGAKPVFVDVGEDFNINPNLIEEKITEKTKAIIPVHFGGSVCDMDTIMDIAQKHNLVVIEDAAHGIGAKFNGKYAGTFGDVGAFSFYATKNLTTGEGGLFITDDDVIADKVRMLSLHGLSQNAWSRYNKGGSWKYEVHYPGFKYNMTDIQAALGTAQMEKFSGMQELRYKIVEQYNDLLKDIDGIILPEAKVYVEHAWHLYPIRIIESIAGLGRDELIDKLNDKMISTSVHFIPLHLQPFYQNEFGYKAGDFPVAEKVYEQEVSIPLYPSLKDSEVLRIVKAISEIVDSQNV